MQLRFASLPSSMLCRTLTLSIVLTFFLLYTSLTTSLFLTQKSSVYPAEALAKFAIQSTRLDTPKYFQEPGDGEIYGHYDLRFWSGEPLPIEERVVSQHHLIRSYLSTFHDLGISTWLAHGSLLGWYWNQKILPWDGDIDVQIWAGSLVKLASEYNATRYEYSATDVNSAGVQSKYSTEYLLDINPDYMNRERGNWMNIIDARWIDLKTGLFVDITALAQVEEGIWSCKNQHQYHIEQILPFKQTMFEGFPALVPSGHRKILVDEYKRKALDLKRYAGYHWNSGINEWVKD